jgi:Zn-dependent protease with chaperone function
LQFFEHQDQARGRTTLLVSLFALAVILLGATAGLATHFALAWGHPPDEPYSENHWSLVATAVILTLGAILLGSAYRMTQLRGGGVKVAETLGGTLVTAQSPELLERRVVNIVEEMAIAAGLPVPPVYVMRGEMGINAFAAGWSPDDAVIGVTWGALEGLNRDQLQGVIAHEFSHILNRDCALNMRLMGVLHGIVVISIIGRMVMHLGSGSSHRTTKKSDGAVQFFLIGLAIWFFGSLGVLIARIIQAAVSRQREYLADASAVQFTRNPEGIAGALATIGSQTSELLTPRASETSHMLISEPGASNFLGALASHPSLFDRIKRILPAWNGEFTALATPPGSVRRALSRTSSGADAVEDEARIHEMLLGGGAAGLALEQVTRPEQGLPTDRPFGESAFGESPLVEKARNVLSQVPPRLRSAAQDPYSARALILAWVLEKEPEDRAAQMALVGRDEALAQETERLAADLPTLDSLAVLPLFDIAVGTLFVLSERQKQDFHALLSDVAAQLSQSSYRAYCLAALALRHVKKDSLAEKKKPVLIKSAIETVLGILASVGHDGPQDARHAFSAGAVQLGNRGAHLEMPPREALTVQNLDAALSTLLRLPTVTRAELLNAAEFIASHDGVLRPSEAELLRAMATCLNVAAEPAFATANR